MGLETWLTTTQAARRLGVHRTYVIRMMAEGRLVHQWTRLGRLIEPASLEAFQRARESRIAEKRVAEERAQYIA